MSSQSRRGGLQSIVDHAIETAREIQKDASWKRGHAKYETIVRCVTIEARTLASAMGAATPDWSYPARPEEIEHLRAVFHAQGETPPF
jgi:hypothetical protein